MSHLRILPLPLAIATALLVGAASAGAAGTATLDGTTARFVDATGAPDDLAVNIENLEAQPAADDVAGWRVGFLQHDPATAPGAGCLVGFVSTICPTGATPSGAAIDLGGGDDKLRISTNPVVPGQRVQIDAGPGNDEVEAYQTNATVDLGPGDDLLRPDTRFSVLALPPEPTPGGVVRGGPGTDTVDYETALDAIDVSLDGKADDGRKGDRDNVMPDVENIVGAQFGGTLIGSDAANVITGGNGADRIVGGGGRDQLDGGPGNDVIDALDGAGGDKVACGDGADVAYVDAGDILASQDVRGGTPCEKVVYAPAASSSTLRYRSRRISVKLACPKVSTATCAGTLRLTTTTGKKLAAASYRAKKGKSTTVALKVRKKPARKAVLVVGPKGSNPIAGRPVSVR